MNNEFKFKIYNKLSNKCFKVTRLDYIDNQVYYLNKENGDEDIVSFNDCELLMPTGIIDISGREIFEGDVVTYQENCFTYKKTAAIIYENGCFITKQLFPPKIEQIAQSQNICSDDFKDLLCIATLSTFKPLKIIGNVFTYKVNKNNKIKLGV